MAYKSLYRKYRPNDFSSVYGQEHIVKILENSLKNNKIAHAYLFTGTRGTGKTTTAKIFARMVNCLEPVEGMPCGKCSVCTNKNTDELQDIIEIDAASNNGVDEIRELRNKMKLVPTLCKYKVYIIDEVHMLSIGAFNALLKTLEEPPEHVIFILATTDPQKLPITVISRCQRFDFKKISNQKIVERLKYISVEEKIDIADNALEEISKLSDGALRDAIGLLDQLNSYSNNKITEEDIYAVNGSVPKHEILQLISMYLNCEYEKLLEVTEKIYLEGKNFITLANDMLYIFRDMLICRKAKTYFTKKEISYKEEICNLSEKITSNQLEDIIKQLENSIVSLKESNYPRILFEIFLLTNISNKIENKKTLEPKQPKNNQEITKQEELTNINDNDSNDDQHHKIIDKTTKEILINNTIYGATSSDKKNAVSALSKINEYITNSEYSKAAAILQDADIKAASNDHILITYKYPGLVDDNDTEINNIEKIFNDILKTNYRVVAITNDEWDTIRPYYLNLSKNKQIKYKDESQTENINIRVANDFIKLIEEE